MLANRRQFFIGRIRQLIGLMEYKKLKKGCVLVCEIGDKYKGFFGNMGELRDNYFRRIYWKAYKRC
jgi:hypothetical protein